MFDESSDAASETLAAVGQVPPGADACANPGHVMRLTLPLEEGARLRLYVARDVSDAPFQTRELAFAEHICRHIERACQLGFLRQDPGRLRLGELEARGVPALLVDAQARLVALNRGAHIFMADAGLRCTPGKGVDFEHETDCEAFDATVRDALRVGGRRVFVPRGGRTDIQMAALIVAPAPTRMLLDGEGAARAPGRGLALVTVARRDRPGTLVAGQLRELFGLTPAESRIAASIASGCSPELTAERYALAIGTVRWHMKRIFAKTSCAGQTELVEQLQALAHTL